MAVNYEFIKYSELELYNEFKSIFKYVVETHQTLFSTLNEKNNDADFEDSAIENIRHRHKNLELMNSDLLGNCIWNIQKNEPRASHLRFIVTIIKNLKDVEIINNYCLKILRFFNKRKLPFDLNKHFIEAYKTTNDVSKKILNEFETNNKIDPNNEKIITIFNDYHKYLKNIIRTSILIYSEKNIKIDNKTLIDLITNFGILERIVEHEESIINSFSLINNL